MREVVEEGGDAEQRAELLFGSVRRLENSRGFVSGEVVFGPCKSLGMN